MIFIGEKVYYLIFSFIQTPLTASFLYIPFGRKTDQITQKIKGGTRSIVFLLGWGGRVCQGRPTFGRPNHYKQSKG